MANSDYIPDYTRLRETILELLTPTPEKHRRWWRLDNIVIDVGILLYSRFKKTSLRHIGQVHRRVKLKDIMYFVNSPATPSTIRVRVMF